THEPGWAAEDAIATKLLSALGIRLEQILGSPRAAFERWEQPGRRLRIGPDVCAGALAGSAVIERAFPRGEHGTVAEVGVRGLEHEAGRGSKRGDVRARGITDDRVEAPTVKRIDERV